MTRISRANRLFEFFLFGGVPESPQTIYEQDINAHAGRPRPTGGPGGGPLPSGPDEEGEVIATLRYSRESKSTEIDFTGAKAESNDLDSPR